MKKLVIGLALITIASSAEAAPPRIRIGENLATENCANNSKLLREAQTLSERAADQLINKNLDQFGGGKNIRVKIQQCSIKTETAANKSKVYENHFDLKLEITWQEKKFWRPESFYVDIETRPLIGLNRNGDIVAFDLIQSSSNLGENFKELFPQRVRYFD